MAAKHKHVKNKSAGNAQQTASLHKPTSLAKPGKPTVWSVLRHSPNGNGWRSFLFRFSLAFIMIILFIPTVLLLLYRSETVHPFSTLMIRDALTGTGAHREWIALEAMTPVLYQSVLMSEDGQFCSHSGVNWTELHGVINDALQGKRTRGASTITMQLVKNLFLWPERSYIRKGLEVSYALLAEVILDKRRIMEIYLNVVELDRGVFGVETASQHYFGRSAAKIGARYSSLLAVSLPNPDARNPANPSHRLKAMAKKIRQRTKASGAYVTCLRDAGS